MTDAAHPALKLGGAFVYNGKLMQGAPILYFNRHTQQVERELVYGEPWLRWAYETPLGRASVWAFFKRPFFSRWYGKRMSTPASASRVAPFIRSYDIQMGDFEKSADQYESFNDFFYRKLKSDARPMDSDESALVFGADARHKAVAVLGKEAEFFVKGQRFDLAKLLGDEKLAERYAGGTLVFSRLCPVDYHRFHFPCDGEAGAPVLIEGSLYSVNPIALAKKLSYLWENRRMRTELKTERFGTIQLLEIGATNVGSIFQTFAPGAVKKGEEKGYFAFGGSALITLFEPGKVTLAADLLEQNAQGRELYARMGTPMAKA